MESVGGAGQHPGRGDGETEAGRANFTPKPAEQRVNFQQEG